MSATSPDFQIVEFSILGVNYIYEGSSREVIIADGVELFPLAEEMNAQLKKIITQHVPASDQIKEALSLIGFTRSNMPRVTYSEDQPDDSMPTGAIS